MYADNNKTDGPALLYNPHCHYTVIAESIICTYQLSLDNLPEKIKDLGFNIDKFCNYALETFKTHQDAGGNDTQTFLKLYEALVSSKIDDFNSEIRAYKAEVVTKDKPLDFKKLMAIVCTKYTHLMICSQWHNFLWRSVN
eukprot:3984664-Ditylum_brightwellii.AAC.1